MTAPTKLHDRSGRRFPDKQLAAGVNVRLTDRDLYLFEKLNVHGPLPTSYLLEFSQHVRKAENRAADRLTLLANEGKTASTDAWLNRPPQQFHPIYTPRNQQLVYDLSKRSVQALQDCGRFHAEYHHGGWYEHQLMTSCITASIELECLRAGYRFIPQHEITPLLACPVPYSYESRGQRVTETANLIPDALFGIDYGSKVRYFALETDRDTESNKSPNFRKKTFRRSMLQYHSFIAVEQEKGGKLYQEAYGIRDGLVVLVVTLYDGTVANMQEIIKQDSESGGKNYIALKAVPRLASLQYNPPKPLAELWSEPWQRAGREPFSISQA